VRTDPPLPGGGCRFVADFMTAAHRARLGGARRPEPALARAAAKEVGRNPHVVAYELGLGPSASYYAWEAVPVHGVKGKP
jgi:hypothetical protein